MGDWAGDQTSIIILGSIGTFVVFLLVWNAVISVRLSRLRKSYKAMMNGAGIGDLEQIITDIHGKLEKLKGTSEEQANQIHSLKRDQEKLRAHVGMVRFHAFGEHSSDMSFSVAMLSKEKDGVVLTGIYNRDSSYVFAKPIEKGQSRYPLTPEEMEAMDRCFVH